MKIFLAALCFCLATACVAISPAKCPPESIPKEATAGETSSETVDDAAHPASNMLISAAESAGEFIAGVATLIYGIFYIAVTEIYTRAAT